MILFCDPRAAMALNSYSANKIVRFAFLVMKWFNRKGVEKVTYM